MGDRLGGMRLLRGLLAAGEKEGGRHTPTRHFNNSGLTSASVCRLGTRQLNSLVPGRDLRVGGRVGRRAKDLGEVDLENLAQLRVCELRRRLGQRRHS